MFDLESQIQTWRKQLYAAGSIELQDIDELEAHLRDSVDELISKDLGEEEAYILAIHRLGDISVIHDEFAKISTEDIWKQLFIPVHTTSAMRNIRKELGIVIILALLAGVLSRIPLLLGYGNIDEYGLLFFRNSGFFALFPVALYCLWKRALPLKKSLWAVSVFPALALVVNLYPSYEPYHTSVLGALHTPILLMFVLLYLYGGPAPQHEAARTAAVKTGWRSSTTRLNFIRFAGETAVYGILIGAGGLLLIFFTVGAFDLFALDAGPFIQNWLAPFGFFGLFTIASFLVWQKKNLIESIAPVLAKIFTPLFLCVLLGLLIAFLITPGLAYENRELLIWFDGILAFVLALTLYSMSAKEVVGEIGEQPPLVVVPSVWDILTFALVAAAVLVNTIAFSGIIVRLITYGMTPNKAAALGENILLSINLLFLAVLYGKYLFRKTDFSTITQFQMKFFSAYAVWAAIVVVVFPPLFGFV